MVKRELIDVNIDALMYYRDDASTPNSNVIPDKFEGEMVQVAPVNDTSKQHFSTFHLSSPLAFPVGVFFLLLFL